MNLIIVEDTKTIRTMLVDLLGGQPDITVVAAVDRVEDALSYLAHHCADVMILDLCLPGLSYDGAVRAVTLASPDLDILVFTVSEEDEMVFSALKAGATGYILKNAQPAAIIAALHDIAAGGSPMSPCIARKVLREFQGPQLQEELQDMVSPLSSRETEIVELLYRGLNIGQIGDRLFISTHTVQTHIKKIYTKLQVNSRSQAIYEAVRKKLIKGGT